MTWLRRLFNKHQLDQQLDAELRFHFERQVADNIRAGMGADEARRHARLQFGGPEQIKEECRDARGTLWLDSILQDLRFALRTLRKSPGFTISAVCTLALGIGANTAIFSVVDAAFIRALPYPAADRLVTIWFTSSQRHLDHGQVSAADYYDWRSQNAVFDSLAAYASWPVNLTNSAEPLRLNAELVSANFFATLGVEAERGRTFAPDEDQEGKDSGVVLSHRLWSQLGASADIVGRSLTLNGSPSIVLGVLPASFDFPSRETDLWIPLSLSAKNRANRQGRWLRVMGRLKPDTSITLASNSMQVIAGRLEKEFPSTNAGWSVQLTPLRKELVGDVQPIILALQGTVALLLLMACANLANLLLARAASRTREIAIRSSLGAVRSRIIRHLLMESLLLATLGGAVGLLLAYQGVALIRVADLGFVPGATEIAINGRVALFALLSSGLTALLFGLIPALHASRIDLQDALKSGGRGSQSGVERQRNLLVTAEIALTFVLLVGAGLLGRSILYLMSIDPGFKADHVLTMRLTLPRSKYPTDQKQNALFEDVLNSVRTLPGVLEAGAVSDLPLSLNNMTFNIVVDREIPPAGSPEPEAALRAISTGYLRTAGIRLLAGRDFTPLDAANTQPVALVNETLARRTWQGANPIGKRIRLKEDQRWLTVVGVVRDIKHMGLGAEEGPVLYTAYAQKTQDWLAWMALAIRTTSNPLDYVGSVRARIRSIDPDQPVSDIATLEQSLASSTAMPRFSAGLVAGISALALVMAVIGVYGVLAWSIAQRTQEIGIRLALGASPNQIVGHLLGRGLVRVSLGICAGILGALALTRLLASMLFGVHPYDPATFAAVAITLLGAAAIALWMPARRVLRVDPTVALRFD